MRSSLHAVSLTVCAASAPAASELAAINTPWRTTCFDCHLSDAGELDFSVIELQSWFQYGITEDQCRNLAAAFDQNYTLASGVDSNFYYTYLDRSHTISSCAVVVAASCSTDTVALLDSGFVGNASVAALEHGSGACASDSSLYFLNSTSQALEEATEDNLDLFQVADNIETGSMDLSSEVQNLVGGQQLATYYAHCH